MSGIEGARRPLKIGKNTYMASPLTDRDVSELDEWLRSRFIEMARSSLPVGATQKQIEDTLAVAMRVAMGLTWMSGEGVRIMRTLDGMAQLAWQMIHHSHPNVTFAEIRAELGDPNNMARVNDAFEHLNVGEGKSFKKEREAKRTKLLKKLRGRGAKKTSTAR